MSRGGDRSRLRAPSRTWRGLAHDCSASELAWAAALPCALAAAALAAALGPPLGRALLAPGGTRFWAIWHPSVLPEPTEHARYLLSLLAPLLLAGAVALASARRIPSRPRALALLVPLAQALLLAGAVAALWVQRTTVFRQPYYRAPTQRAYFTAPTLLVAGALALALAAALAHAPTRRRASALARDTPARRAAAIVIALALIALWLLPAVNSDATVGVANRAVAVNVGNWLDEAMAVLDHQAPLVHLRAQYGQLWPYLSAGVMALLGTSLSVFVGTMLAGTAAALLAVLALLRRLAHSWLAALALFAPFLATSFFIERGPLANRYTPAHLFSLFPMRYGGAYVLAWLTLRHLDGTRPRRRPLLFLVGGLVVVNNAEFGLPAFAATLAAVVWSERVSVRGLVAIARDAALGALLAVAAVAALTLAVEGSLPHFGLALTFSRMYAVEGFGMLPMGAVGAHLVLYATFAAALAVATARAAARRADAPLTGMLAWIGVFGLGAGSYFVGRSHPEVLIDLFSPWALALALLLIVLARHAAAQERWRPSPADLALLAGVALAFCSLAQLPAPWSQLQRLSRTSPEPVFHPLATEQAIAAQTRRGEPVAMIVPVGHRIAYDLGIVDVTPYSDPVLPAQQELAQTIAALRAAGGRTVFVAMWIAPQEQLAALQAAGFRMTSVDREVDVATFVDTRARGG